MVRGAMKQAPALYDEHAELQEVLHDIAGERGDINRRRLGWWIKRRAVPGGSLMASALCVPAATARRK